MDSPPPILDYGKRVATRSSRVARSFAILSSIGICLLSLLWAGMRMQQAEDWRRCGAEARTGFNLYPDAERFCLMAFGICAIVCAAWIVVWLLRPKRPATI
jgi:hypothetical protein